MAFLDNSGDIVLDAVLTDYGRKLLAQGNATITSFAFFDDEIDYGLYNNSHPSGSAYYDLEIMQTPILEAFTNNASIAKYTLYASNLSNELFYLPVIKLKDGGNNFDLRNSDLTSTGITFLGSVSLVTGSVILLANTTTDTSSLATSLGNDKYLKSTGVSEGSSRTIRMDAGIDSLAATRTSLTTELQTNSIYVKYDSRLLIISDSNSGTDFSPISIDDDSIATVLITSDANPSVISPSSLASSGYVLTSDTALNTNAGFDCSIYIRTKPKTDSLNNDYYFSLLGSTNSTVNGISGVKTIDTSIQVISQNTGQSINVPIKICKQ